MRIPKEKDLTHAENTGELIAHRSLVRIPSLYGWGFFFLLIFVTMKIIRYDQGGGIPQGGIPQGGETPQGGEIPQGDDDYKEGDMVAKDGAVYKVMKGGQLAKQTPGQVISYLNSEGFLVSPGIAGKRSDATYGIKEALLAGDMEMLSEYMHASDSIPSPIKGLALRPLKGQVDTPVGKGVYRYPKVIDQKKVYSRENN